MSEIAAVRTLVATMLMLPADQVGPGTSLRSLDNSLGSTKLMLGLKRLGISPGFRKVPPTFGDLESEITGVAVSVSAVAVNSASYAAAPPLSASESGALRIGHDLQEISSLPSAADYWDHEFYQGCFSRAELAYAVVQSEPKTHFAGFWAAKEALKKCDAAFIDADLTYLTISHDDAGKPFLFHQKPGSTVRLPHTVSISHSGNMASAVVAMLAASPGNGAKAKAEPVAEPQPPALPAHSAPQSESESGSRSMLLVMCVVLLLCIAGVLFYVHHRA